MNVQHIFTPDSGLSNADLEFWNTIMTYAGHVVSIPGSSTSFRFMPADVPSSEQIMRSVSCPDGTGSMDTY